MWVRYDSNNIESAMDERQLIKNRKNNKKLKITYLIRFINSFDVLNRYLEIKLSKVDTDLIMFVVLDGLVTHGGSMIPQYISN
jgi:hypothetical protein